MTGATPARLERLVRAAREVRERAHAPYSRFKVGAAVLVGGRVYTGVNVENAAYPLSVCAERNAVAAAVAAGARRIDAVAVVAGGKFPASPCGGCRQVLWEFGDADVPVVSEQPDGRRAAWTLGELLPAPFTLGR